MNSSEFEFGRLFEDLGGIEVDDKVRRSLGGAPDPSFSASK
jgi:hypothetical protein